MPLCRGSSAEKGSPSDVCVDRKQSARKWSRRKESGDSLGGRQRVPILHIGLGFFDMCFTNFFHFCPSKKKKGLLRMKDALLMNQYSALQIFTTALKKSVELLLGKT